MVALIDLPTAALIAKLTSDGINSIDKIWRGFSDFARKKAPNSIEAPPPNFSYQDSPQNDGFSAIWRDTGQVQLTVTYKQLCERLSPGDLQYIQTLTATIEMYEQQWQSIYKQRPMASGLQLAQFDTQLEYIAQQLADPINRILEFVVKMGMFLEDHYSVARSIAREYLANSGSA